MKAIRSLPQNSFHATYTVDILNNYHFYFQPNLTLGRRGLSLTAHGHMTRWIAE